MTPRLAMILSIGGVLLAGTAAAAVNTEVLRRDSTPPVTAPDAPAADPAPTVTSVAIPSSAAPTPAPSSVPSSAVPPSSVAPSSVAPSSSSTSVATTSSTGPATTTTPATAAPSGTGAPVGVPVPGSTTQQSFQLGTGGTAVVDTAGGRLRIVSVTPSPGWIVDRAEHDDPTSIEIRLESASGEVRFEASLVRGVIVVSFRADHDGEDTGGDDNSGPGGDDTDGDDNSGPGGDDSGSGSGSGSG